MADNRSSRYASNEPSFLSDDDPLAELARIAGHGPIDRYGRPADDQVTLPESFDLDLEAELMREFEERADTSEDEVGAAGAQPEAPQSSDAFVDEPAPREELAAEDIPAFLKTRHSMPEEPEAASEDSEDDAAASEQELPAPASEAPGVAAFDPADEAVVRVPESEYVAPAALQAAPVEAEPEPVNEPAAEAASAPDIAEGGFGDMSEDWTDLPEWPAQRPQSAVRSDPDTEAFLPDGGESDPMASEPDDMPAAGDTGFDTATEIVREEATIVQAAAHDDAMLLEDDSLEGSGAEPGAEEISPEFAPEEPDTRTSWDAEETGQGALEAESDESSYVVAEDRSTPLPLRAEDKNLDLESAEAEPAAGAATDPAAEEDEIWSHFARYDVPSREPLVAPAEPAPEIAHAEETPVATGNAAVRDEWDIADEIERAFLDIRSPVPVEEATAIRDAAGEQAPATIFEHAREPEPTSAIAAESRHEEPEPSAALTLDGYLSSEATGAAPDAAAPEAAVTEEEVASVPDSHIDFDFDDLELELAETAQTTAEDEPQSHAAPATTAAAGLAAYAARSAEPERGLMSETTSPASRPDEFVEDRRDYADAAPARSLAPAAAPADTFRPATESMAAQHDYAGPADYSAEDVAERWDDGDRDIAFDVREVADMGQMVEPVAEIDVPELPRDEATSGRVVDDDFDLSDLEAEFADVLAREEVAGSVQKSEADLPAETAPDAIDFAQYDFAELGQSPKGRAAAAVAQDRGESGIPVHYGVVQTNIDRDLEFADFDNQQPEPARQPLLSRYPKWKIGAIAAVLLCGVAVGALALSGGGAISSDEPRVIAANDEPMKVVPEDRGGRDVPNQDQAVYNQVDGSGRDDEINLVSRSEEPIDVVRRTIDPQVLPLEGRPDPDSAEADEMAAVPVDQSGQTDLAALDQEPAAAEPEQDEAARIAVTPRRVETMVVRADGTLVPRSETEAPEAADPAEALAAGELMVAPGGQEAADGFVEETQGEDFAALAAAGEDGAAQDAATPPRLLPQDDSQEPAVVAPVRTVRTTAITESGGPVVPTERPIDQPANIVGSTADQSAAGASNQTETAALAPMDQPLDNPGGYVVQIASQPSEESARATYQSLSQRYDSIIGGRDAQIQSAEIPDRGTYYRVRIAGGTREEATALCERYQAAGGSCFVAR